jgi:hypothetical protein
LQAAGYVQTLVLATSDVSDVVPQVVSMHIAADHLVTIRVLDPHGVRAKDAAVHAWTAKGEGMQPSLIAVCDDNGEARVGFVGSQYLGATGKGGLARILLSMGFLFEQTR